LTWQYQGAAFTETPDLYQGFVYMITNTAYNKRYIGKKNFWRTVKLPPLKGKTRRRHRRESTDWPQYYGSSTLLNTDLAQLGPNTFTREILVLCTSKNQMNYEEARLQFALGVLLSDDWYNGIINCRVSSRGLR
jgi:hypothetical protein